MIDFVGTCTPPVLRIALWVSMETMHFHIAKINLGQSVSQIGGPNEKYGTLVKLSGGVQGRSNKIPE